MVPETASGLIVIAKSVVADAKAVEVSVPGDVVDEAAAAAAAVVAVVAVVAVDFASPVSYLKSLQFLCSIR